MFSETTLIVYKVLTLSSFIRVNANGVVLPVMTKEEIWRTDKEEMYPICLLYTTYIQLKNGKFGIIQIPPGVAMWRLPFLIKVRKAIP